MAKKTMFQVLNEIPSDVPAGGLHPLTKEIINQLKSTKGRVLACKFKNAREAKNRIEALRRAKAKGYANYKKARRKANVLYFKLR